MGKEINSWVHFVGFISRLCFQYFLVKMYVRRSVKNWNWCCIYDILCKIFLDRWYILFVYLIVKVSYVINLHMYSCICFTRGNISSRFNRKYSICFSDGHVPLMLAQDFTVFFYNGQWGKNFLVVLRHHQKFYLQIKNAVCGDSNELLAKKDVL